MVWYFFFCPSRINIFYLFFISDKIVTASFDKTAKLWNASNGACLRTYYGHRAEVVATDFSSSSTELLATASIDRSSKIFNTETSQILNSFSNHGAEVIACKFHKYGDVLLTASFDNNAYLWDLRTQQLVLLENVFLCFFNSLSFFSPIVILRGHEAELSNCQWSFNCTLIATSSLDGTARLWDFRSLKTLNTFTDHRDEVLDICFDYPGKHLATASSDCTARVYNVEENFEIISVMGGHCDEVSRVRFSPAGNLLLTASGDHTARLWNVENGTCSQTLAGHSGDVFSCAFNYNGNQFTPEKVFRYHEWK